MQEMQNRSLGLEEHLEKEMATHSIILAWEIPWTEEPGGLQGQKESDVTWTTIAICEHTIFPFTCVLYNVFP